MAINEEKWKRGRNIAASETLGVNIFNLTGEARSISLTNRLNPPVASIDHLFIKKRLFLQRIKSHQTPLCFQSCIMHNRFKNACYFTFFVFTLVIANFLFCMTKKSKARHILQNSTPSLCYPLLNLTTLVCKL